MLKSDAKPGRERAQAVAAVAAVAPRAPSNTRTIKPLDVRHHTVNATCCFLKRRAVESRMVDDDGPRKISGNRR
jgi:hypothetical protein